MMKKLLWGSLSTVLLCCLTACSGGSTGPYVVSEADSIYRISNVLKICYSQPEVAIQRLDSCELKGLNSVDSICFYRGTLHGLLKNSDGMFSDWDRILFREGADVGSPLYLHVLKSAASMLNNRNQKVKALEYCLLGDSLAAAHDNEFASLQFKVLAANIGNECFVQKENVEILEQCVEKSKPFLEEKRKFNTHLFFREDLYDAYCRYNAYSSAEDKKDNLFLYNYACETKNLIDQVVEKHHGGVSNESLDYKYIQCYGQMIELLVKMGRKKEAQAIFEEKAKPLCQGASRVLRTANNIAMMQAALGMNDEPIDYYLKSIAQNEAREDSVSMMVDLNILCDCYEQKGDYQRAYQTLRRYHDLYKWKARKDFLGQSSEYLTLFKVQEHTLAQQEAEAEARYSQIGAIIVSIVLVVVICLLSMLWRQNRVINQRNRALVANINEILDAKKQEKSNRTSDVEAPAENVANDEYIVQRYIYELCSRHLFCNPDFNRDDLLDELGFQKTGFWKLFEEETGQRFASYLLNIRLEHAAEMIREHPELTVDAIALDSGFSSRSTFYRNFTTRFGISPKVYRGELEG